MPEELELEDVDVEEPTSEELELNDELDPEEDVEEPAPFGSSERAPHPVSAASVEASQNA